MTQDLGGLLDKVPDALVGVDRAGVIRYFNTNAESLFGYDRVELIGKHIETLVPDSVKPVHPAHREKYFAYVKAKRTEPAPDTAGGKKAEAAPHCLRGRKRGGAEFPMNLGLSTIDTEDGVLVIAAVRATTDPARANEKRERMSQLEVLVELSKDAVVSIGPDGVITTWNPAAEKMYGVSSDEMIGQSGWLTSPDHSPR